MQGDGGHRNEVLTLSWQPVSGGGGGGGEGGGDDDGDDGDSLLLSGGCRGVARLGWMGAL